MMSDTNTDPSAVPAKARRRFSELLQAFAEDHTAERVTVGDLLTAMQGRAIAALLFLFAFPNILPTPPGVAAVLGLPLIYLSSQLMLGRQPWLPGFIANRSMTRDAFRNIVSKATPILNRAEKMLQQRWWPLVSPVMERVLGGVCLALAVLLSLPIPLGNLLPAAAICVIALALLERDGLWVIVGLISTVAAFGWVGSIAYALVKSAIFVVINAFG
ncbi:exopolysaccharide biosynthesis protein [Gemmobacter fulvus]|uniref:Exopolysaccharide biosynthesis protein n=1 Tax=Gemmobacter fulvus TaxID=2840474 RepID=A0A975P4S0_9RHOB|nr:exopolysaccharide biosynthesis protein [Gemmobacter fulvus]MBT9245821.1 exopolysaccharide biosynthesis protein [Gemmobacter fulvus]MDQ1846964.1 exopolysaccharide biosynthesis protein [Gemmobacter fulvus]QWK89342.1 exopolysaccharide biosynthesis protein [Gemmobacter fulvus]